VNFFVYSRAASSAPHGEHDSALDERHWSYMDRFAEGMIARGPTFDLTRETWTGSLHILELPSVDAAHEFVEREPYNRAGLFGEHLIRRFDNLLGRTMWDSPKAGDDPLFLVIAHADPAPVTPDRLIVYGTLRALDDGSPAGVALALQAPDRAAVESLLGGAPAWEIHAWEFGGRR
jgi:uncharacterized protein